MQTGLQMLHTAKAHRQHLRPVRLRPCLCALHTTQQAVSWHLCTVLLGPGRVLTLSQAACQSGAAESVRSS